MTYATRKRPNGPLPGPPWREEIGPNLSTAIP